MTIERVIEKLNNFKEALSRLEEALAVSAPDQFVGDAIIKRFEFTYELAWRLLKALIEFKGLGDLRFPRDVLKEAYASGLLDNSDIWLRMLSDRNMSSHTYDRETAAEIILRIRNDYYTEFLRLTETVARELKP